MKHSDLNISMDIDMELHPFEKRLIEILRSIDSGEVSSIKVQDGLPVIFQIAHKGNDLSGGE